MRLLGRPISLALTLSILNLSACSAFLPDQESVTIKASVEGADILVDDNYVGTSPVTVDLDRTTAHKVTAMADGRTGTSELSRTISFAGAMDITGTILFAFPIIGCFTPGFWSLGPDPLTVKIPDSHIESAEIHAD
jgi:PEGA domain